MIGNALTLTFPEIGEGGLDIFEVKLNDIDR